MATPPWLTDELLEKARALASLAHEQSDKANEAVVKAALWLDTSTEGAEETLLNRLKKERNPTRLVLLGEPLFQRLVYLASDQLARLDGVKEICGQSPARMLARYLQFLILRVLKRSSRWTAVGFAQLVYGYDGAQADLMIERVTGKPWERRKKTKAELMNELSGRFPGLRVVEAQDGDYRHFEPCQDQQQFQPTIWRWLDLLTPWHSEHCFNRRPTPRGTLDPDWSELDRCHAFIHSDCFGQLVGEIGLTPHVQKLRLPRLVRCENGDETVLRDTGASGSSGSNASPGGDVSAIRKGITRETRRRGKVSGEFFEIRIDGQSAGSLEGPDAGVRFTLPSGADVVEIYGGDGDGDVLIATHLLQYSDDGSPAPSTGAVKLGRGHTLTFDVDVPECGTERIVAFCRVRHVGTPRLLWAPSDIQPSALLWAAAALVILALGSATAVQNYRLRHELAQLQAVQARLQDRQQELQQQLGELRTATRAEKPNAASASSPAQPRRPGEIVIAVLTPRLRGTGGSIRSDRIVVPASARTLVLNLALEREGNWAAYEATIETVARAVLGRFSGLKQVTGPDGQKMVPVRIPVQELGSLEYVLRLSARKLDGTTEDVDDYSFAITLTP